MVAPASGGHMDRIALASQMMGGVVEQIRKASSGHSGTLENFRPRRASRYDEARSLDLVMARAESLVGSDGHAASCVDSLALNVAGPGLRPQSYPDLSALGIESEAANEFADSAEAAWKIWCAEADAADTDHFDDLQYQSIRSMFVTGEFLHLPVWLDPASDPCRTFGLALQALHPARLRTPSDKMTNPTIRAGVQLGIGNRPLGYWIAEPREGRMLLGLTSKDFRFVPRKIAHRYTCLHQRHAIMPEQLRGESLLSPAMKHFRDLADYVDYELVGALIAACFTVFIESPSTDVNGQALPGHRSSGEQDPRRPYPAEVEPGLVMRGKPGDKIHTISNNRPAPSFDAFYTRMTRMAAASTGQPYEIVAKDFSKTNYSSARAALLEVWKLHTMYQDWFIRSYLQRIWVMVMEEAHLRGLLAMPKGAPGFYESMRAWCAAIWTRPPRGNIDPVKERKAESLGLETLTETRTSICHSGGKDWDAVLRTLEREDKAIRKAGLVQVLAPVTPDNSTPPNTASGEEDLSA